MIDCYGQVWLYFITTKNGALLWSLGYILRCKSYFFYNPNFRLGERHRSKTMYLGLKINGLNKAYLPTSFNGIKIIAKGARDDPKLWQTEFILVCNSGRPHINACLGSIVLISIHESYRMLPLQENIFTLLEFKL